jgi:signal transduction histidine kinase
LQDLVHGIVSPLNTAALALRRLESRLRGADVLDEGSTRRLVVDVAEAAALVRRARLASMRGLWLDLEQGSHHPFADLMPAASVIGVVRRTLEDVQILTARRRPIVFKLRAKGCRDQAVLFDPDALELCVNELLENAVAFAFAGTVVEVAVEGNPRSIEIRVRSRGLALEPEEAARATERGFRATSAERSTPGSGLGLWMVDNVMRLQGGSVAIVARAEVITVTLLLSLARRRGAITCG